MATIDERIKHEIDWRVSEISIIKSMPYLYPVSAAQRKVLVKHTIPVFYSLWEGFVADCFQIYSHEINIQRIPADKICLPLVTHAIDTSLFLHQQRIEFDKKIKFVNDIQTYLNGDINLPTQVPTKSNVNFKVINQILTRFNLELLPDEPYKKSLDRLLFFRNKLAHGEFSIVIEQKNVDEMSDIVISSFHILAERVVDGFNKKTYLR